MLSHTTLTVVSLALLAVSAPAQAASRKTTSGALARRAPHPLPEPAPAAQGQHAPLTSNSRRRRSAPAASTSTDEPLVKKRDRRSARSHDKRSLHERSNLSTNPKPRRVPVNPKFAKRSTSSPSTSWSLSQASMGGYDFFDDWDWFTWADPTHGWVNYQSEQESWDNGLVYVPDTGRNSTIMRVDSWSNLPYGAMRNSVRISSKQKVDIGSLVIADIPRIPYGPTVWPAFWMVGDNWPYGGEIDIIEGVHDSVQNQYTLHTAPGCTLTTPMKASGNVLETNCDAFENFNTGCGVQSSDKQSYGSAWNAAGGGVYATQFDETGISMWNFLRDNIPSDIVAGKPDPSNWGTPNARFDASSCDVSKYFASQNLVFDITLGGDWAGATYNAAGFSGTWQDAIRKGKNFEQAVWEVNYVKVFTKDS
ncbi:hypothetical protein JCM10212_002472 [Sporobolomyces blumeae]